MQAHMTLGQRRSMNRVRNAFYDVARLAGLAAILGVLALITMIAREILGR